MSMEQAKNQITSLSYWDWSSYKNGKGGSYLYPIPSYQTLARGVV